MLKPIMHSITTLPALCVFQATLFVAYSNSESYNSKCIGCICRSKGCNLGRGCEGDVCGPFAITKTFWADAGWPTLEGENSASDGAFENCANNYECSARTVEAYINKYENVDCNNDEMADCLDFAAMLQLGPEGCKHGYYNEKFINDCMEQ